MYFIMFKIKLENRQGTRPKKLLRPPSVYYQRSFLGASSAPFTLRVYILDVHGKPGHGANVGPNGLAKTKTHSSADRHRGTVSNFDLNSRLHGPLSVARNFSV
jgi:hypothetical protein